MKILNEKIIRAPVNKIAAHVIAKGEHYDDSVKDDGNESDLPLPITAMPKGTKDLRGLQQGRFTVVGKHPGTGWVVRCACGRYAKRKGAALTNPNNSNDMCRRCRNAEYKKAFRGLNG
jgi:hypothetical protein